MASPVERMNAYKGSSFPDAIIPLSGTVMALGVPWLLYNHILAPSSQPDDPLLVVLPSLVTMSFLFFVEFALGAAARSTSTKASFSPAAAAHTHTSPFEVVRCNRIHQNHIESACIYLPAALSAVGCQVDPYLIVATTVSWVLFRICYRVGYCHSNPFWRIFGTTASLWQTILCWIMIGKYWWNSS